MNAATQQVLLAAGEAGTAEQWIFWILAPVAVIGGLGMVMARNAIHSALWLVMTMLSLGIFYVVQAGPFIGMVQIIVYTGAIMMLFIFVLMLVGRDSADSLIETLRGQKIWAVVLGAGVAALLGIGAYQATRKLPIAGLDAANAADGGNVQGIAHLLFTKYVFAFEIASALLITAAVGAMLLAHRERAKGEKVGQPAKMRDRFAPGNYPGPKPGPGVYATSTSVAAAAKLPDGSPSQRSISPILPQRELTASEIANKPTEGR